MVSACVHKYVGLRWKEFKNKSDCRKNNSSAKMMSPTFFRKLDPRSLCHDAGQCSYERCSISWNNSNFSLGHHAQTGSRAHFECRIPALKRLENDDDHSFESNAKAKIACMYISAPSYVFFMWCHKTWE